MGRIYLPLEDLDRFGVTPDDLERRIVDDRFRALMNFEVDRAREYFERAQKLIPLVHEDSRCCPVLLARFYSRILDRIERAEFDVFSRRPRLPLWEKVGLLGGAWAGRLLGTRR